MVPMLSGGPLLLQTAACGPAGAIATEVPPNCRYVTVNGNGDLCNLRLCNLTNPPKIGYGEGSRRFSAIALSQQTTMRRSARAQGREEA